MKLFYSAYKKTVIYFSIICCFGNEQPELFIRSDASHSLNADN